ncbi:MAG: endonuclease/exonuclease/phosphatase family protein [Spirochaetaceae bacterium]|nr:endonuclease/exonuclease/phosphatase family protein [Spirochaetaceae bacterium]
MGVLVNWRSVFVWMLRLVEVCLMLPLLLSCSHQQDEVVSGKGAGKQLHVVSWNVQTFFDAQTSGLEYSEFRGSKSRWSRELYEARLERLAEAIELLDADILVLQEIENMAVMYDISNRLAGRLRGNDAYGWMSFHVEEGSAIGCGVFSRLPLGRKLVHQVDCRIRGEQPQLRPLLEVEVLLGEGSGSDEAAAALTLFVCHWKSKSGGAEEAAFWQLQQEALLELQLQRVLTSPTGTGRALVCGDFNRELSEFSSVSSGGRQVFLGAVAAENGWLHPNTTSSGSYWYQDDWERIDHVFVAGRIQLLGFEAVDSGPWVQVNELGQKIPHRYAMWRDEGYSDHLPVACRVAF